MLSAAELIEKTAVAMKARLPNAADKRDLDLMMDAVVSIFEACNFQDITGQRIGKVVRTLDFIEERVVAMIQTWGTEAFAHLPHTVEVPVAEEAKLLNGPQLQGKAISQADIDVLFQCSGAGRRFWLAGSVRAGPSEPEPEKKNRAADLTVRSPSGQAAPVAQQVALAERLDHQVGGTGSEAALIVVGIEGARDRQDRDRAVELGQSPQRLDRHDPVHIRQSHVDHHGVEPVQSC